MTAKFVCLLEKLISFCSEKISSIFSKMPAQFLDQIRTIEEQAPSHLFLSAKTEVLIATPSRFKILLAVRIQTAALSVASEIQFCLTELWRHALFDVTSFFEKG